MERRAGDRSCACEVERADTNRRIDITWGVNLSGERDSSVFSKSVDFAVEFHR